MNNIYLPPLPAKDEFGPHVCEIMRLYLAVWDDLTVTQKQIISEHIQHCTGCALEQQLLMYTTQLMVRLDASSPSPRVDASVRKIIASRNSGRTVLLPWRHSSAYRSI